MTTNNTPILQYSDPTPTHEGFEMTREELQTMKRNALQLLFKLHRLENNIPDSVEIKIQYIEFDRKTGKRLTPGG